MIDKEKAHPTAATVERAGQENSSAGVFPCLNCSTPPARRQVVAEWLEHGEQNGKTMRRLQEFLNGSSREIRLAIQRERLGGTPILSGQSGYFLPANDDEVERFCKSMSSRSREIQKTVRAVARGAGLGKCAPQLDGQTDFWSGDESA